MKSMRLVKENKYILFYYAILFILLSTRTNLSAPNALIRLTFLLAFFIPLFLKYTYLYLPCLVAFITVSTKHFAFGYMPYEMSTYAMISLVSFITVYGIRRNQAHNVNPVFLLLLLYVLLVNVAYSGSPQNITYSIITVCFGGMITKVRTGGNIVNNMLHCFVFASLALSLIYLINFEQFIQSYSEKDGMERSGWTDPNYLSCIVGMGSLSSLILLLKNKHARIYSRLLWVITLVLSTISQVLMASRGGILAVSGSVVVLILFANVKKIYKVAIVLSLFLFIGWLYNNGYFELLSYRIENDADGSGRLDIWQTKLAMFSQSGNVFNWIFGIGYQNAMELSESGDIRGFHNDFIAVLCGYGIVGFIAFLYLLLVYPFQKSSKRTLPVVIALVMYLVLSCMTLEPISLGQISFIAFYYMILLLAEE